MTVPELKAELCRSLYEDIRDDAMAARLWSALEDAGWDSQDLTEIRDQHSDPMKVIFGEGFMDTLDLKPNIVWRFQKFLRSLHVEHRDDNAKAVHEKSYPPNPQTETDQNDRMQHFNRYKSQQSSIGTPSSIHDSIGSQSSVPHAKKHDRASFIPSNVVNELQPIRFDAKQHTKNHTKSQMNHSYSNQDVPVFHSVMHINASPRESSNKIAQSTTLCSEQDSIDEYVVESGSVLNASRTDSIVNHQRNLKYYHTAKPQENIFHSCQSGTVENTKTVSNRNMETNQKELHSMQLRKSAVFTLRSLSPVLNESVIFRVDHHDQTQQADEDIQHDNIESGGTIFDMDAMDRQLMVNATDSNEPTATATTDDKMDNHSTDVVMTGCDDHFSDVLIPNGQTDEGSIRKNINAVSPLLVSAEISSIGQESNPSKIDHNIKDIVSEVSVDIRTETAPAAMCLNSMNIDDHNEEKPDLNKNVDERRNSDRLKIEIGDSVEIQFGDENDGNVCSIAKVIGIENDEDLNGQHLLTIQRYLYRSHPFVARAEGNNASIHNQKCDGSTELILFQQCIESDRADLYPISAVVSKVIVDAAPSNDPNAFWCRECLEETEDEQFQLGPLPLEVLHNDAVEFSDRDQADDQKHKTDSDGAIDGMLLIRHLSDKHFEELVHGYIRTASESLNLRPMPVKVKLLIQSKYMFDPERILMTKLDPRLRDCCYIPFTELMAQ